MKHFLATVILLLASALCFAQGSGVATIVGQIYGGQLNPATATTSQAGAVTNPASNFIMNISPGPIVCSGSGVTDWMNQSTMTLAASNTYLIVYNCPLAQVYAKQAVTGPGGSGTVPPGVPTSLLYAIPNVEIPLATVVCGTTNCGNSANGSITDNRVVGSFPIISDWEVFIPETACFGATTGTAGSGNATDILAGSGGARVYRVSATNASSSANTFTCNFQVPSKLTAGHGFTVNDITFLVSTQTTQPTSITLPTLKTFSAPAAVDPETANSATFVTSGGTITQAPTSAQFAVYAAVTAGQFYTVKASLGTPVLINTDLTVFQFTIVFNQSASAASLQETPGFFVHGAAILN